MSILFLLTFVGTVLSQDVEEQPGTDYYPTVSDTPETLGLPGQAELLERYGIDLEENTEPDTWLDATQSYLSKTAQTPVTWFDSFFGSELADEEGYASTFIRVRLPLTWSEDDGFDSKPEFKAQVHLPRATRKLKLIVTSDDRDPEDPSSAPPGTAGTQDQGSVSLRYDLAETVKSRFSISAGARSDPDLYARLRYRFLTPMGYNSLFRLTQTVYYLVEAQWEGETRFDLERTLDPFTLLRWTNSGFYSKEKIDLLGLEWSSELALASAISRKVGLLYSLTVAGVTKPNTYVTNYSVLSRYRKNFFRDWLFYEVEPALAWVRDEFGEFKPVGSMTLRLEIQLGWQKTG